MSKRFILFISLSFLIILVWSGLAQKFYPIDSQEVRTKEILSPAPHIPSQEKEIHQEKESYPVSIVSHGKELIFSLPSACLEKIVFSQFDNYTLSLNDGLCFVDKGLIFIQKKADSQEAIFVHQDQTRRITKHFKYPDPNFIITLDIKIENLAEQSLFYPSELILGSVNLKPQGIESRFKEIVIKQQDRMLRINPFKKNNKEHFGEFFGFRDRYFCAIIIPTLFPEALNINRVNNSISQLYLSRPKKELLPGQIEHLQYKCYLGPQNTELLRSFHNGAQEIINYGFFDPISKILLNILRLTFGFLHNWGLAIIIMSVMVYFILFPLSIKQLHSMKEMQKLQPKIEELRRLYKDNPQRLNKETLELYRNHKINPLGGCLPMLLQIPIFFALFQALMRSIELKGANFLWIKDLSQPDRLIISPEINILPILMAITMFWQQKSMMISSASPQSEQQRLMSVLFPVMFGVFFYRMPSGLVLYWFINSLLMSIFQKKMRMKDAAIEH